MSKGRNYPLLTSAMAAGLAGLLAAPPALAQDEDEPPAEPSAAAAEAEGAEGVAEEEKKPLTMDRIVVVGTAGGGGIRKQDASFAVTTLDAGDIEKYSPKSTADLLKSVPGIWVESSGGVSGANIFVRGFPGTGDADFVTISLNGSPIYPPPTLSFLENSTLFRIDETIQRVEGLRGGPNSVFSNGQIGMTANFVLKEGGEDTEGLVKYSTSDYGLQRVDAMISGKLAEGLYYMAGGYFKSSPGIRDAQFHSDEGQQFTVNLTKDFAAGKVNVFARLTDDHGQWYLPFGIDVPGLDLGHHSQLGNFTRFRELQVNSGGGTQIFDFADGRGWEGIVVGGNAEFELGGGFTLRDTFSFTKGEANTFGFVPDGTAIPVSALGGPVTTAGGVELNDDDFVQNYGHWVVLKDIDALSNDLSLSKTIDAFGTHELTAGYYISRFSSDDWWSLGNAIPVHVTANGDRLDPAFECSDLADANSGSSCFLFGINSAGDGRVRAFYIADSWQVLDPLRVDAAFRHETFETDYVLDTSEGGTSFPDGDRDLAATLERDDVAWTVGANYDVMEDLGVFARYSEGVKFPSFDQIREGFLDTQFVEQVEAGVKLSKPWLGLFVTGFYNEFQGATFFDEGTETTSVNTNEAYGVEIDAQAFYKAFTLTVNSTLQHTEIIESSDPDEIGNKAQRQPEWQVRITPAYDFHLGDLINLGDVTGTLYGTFTAIGDRFSDNLNRQSLDGYEKLDLGMIVYVGKLSFQVVGDNVTESEGLTEGDPRSDVLFNARPILGRSVKFSVGYIF